MQLVIVESPTKAKAIKQYLGEGYEVVASKGHVRNIRKKPFGVDVDDHFHVFYETDEKTQAIVDMLKDKAAEADSILLATDPDREGEAIAWHLCDVLGIDPDSKCRIEYQEVTKQAVLKALENPRQVNNNLKEAAMTRSVLDYLVGFKVSSLLWRKVVNGLSAGRVQTPVLHLICEREKAREDFIPETTWNVCGKVGPLEVESTAVYREESAAETAAKDVSGVPFRVSGVKRSNASVKPGAPFTTSMLQQAGSNQLGFDTDSTMSLAQRLFEGIKLKDGRFTGLITYHRTDSVRVSEEAVMAARAQILKQFGERYLPETPRTYTSKGKKKNSTAAKIQDAHEAIRPVDMTITPEDVEGILKEDEFKLYRLIYNRFLSSQMQDAERETISVRFDAKGQEFRGAASRIVFPGYRKAYETLEEKEESYVDTLPEFREGEQIDAEGICIKKHVTKPEARYTQASIVREMEDSGIGRPSTYASMIRTVKDRGYVEQDGKALIPRPLGKIVDDKLQSYFTVFNVEFTKDMEEKLDEIEKGKMSREETLSEYWSDFSSQLEKAQAEMPKWQPDDADRKCPVCGGKMVKRIAKNGFFLACSNFPACTHTEPLPEMTGPVCKTCGKRMEKKHRTNGNVFYVCSNPDCAEYRPNPRKSAKSAAEAADGEEIVEILPWAKSVTISKRPCTAMKLAKRIASASPEELKLSGKELNDWLVSQGILEERPDRYGNARFLPTEKGTEMGAETEDRKTDRKPYEIALLSQDIQRLVIRKLKAILG